MEERKQKEVEYYNQKAGKMLALPKDTWQGDFEGFDPFLLSSYQFLQEYLKNRCKGKKILDLGCGNGVHSFWLLGRGAEVVGIDLSEKSLKIAKEKAKIRGAGKKIKFLLMDAEKLDFPDNSFDIIFDGGTFSSLDIKKVYPELARVLKPNGFLIGIETFGHNPFTNFKRQINRVLGKRTGWAASHIFKMDDIENAKKYFSTTKIHFFNLTSWVVIPFLNVKIFRRILKMLQNIDTVLLKPSLLQKYSFKVVFIFSHPKKR